MVVCITYTLQQEQISNFLLISSTLSLTLNIKNYFSN